MGARQSKVDKALSDVIAEFGLAEISTPIKAKQQPTRKRGGRPRSRFDSHQKLVWLAVEMQHALEPTIKLDAIFAGMADDMAKPTVGKRPISASRVATLYYEGAQLVAHKWNGHVVAWNAMARLWGLGLESGRLKVFPVFASDPNAKFGMSLKVVRSDVNRSRNAK